MRTLPGTAAIALLAACATVPDPREPLLRQPAGNCRADAAQRFTGQRASADSAAAILAATGASRLRWGPPRSALTMDYSEGRVTVFYDDAYRITRVSCG
ncbi:MAG: I78 family peptidase inhibitor [Croceibacterium sp.]